MRTSNRRGGIIAGLLIVTVLVCIGVAVAGFIAVRNLRVVKTHRASGEDVSIDTPAGRIEIRAHEKLDPTRLGVPVYPGATRTKDGGSASFEWTSSDGKDDKALAVSGGELITPDSAQTVVDYYKTQLPSWLVVREHNGATRLELNEGGYKRIIVVHEKGDGTHIGIATVGQPASN